MRSFSIALLALMTVLSLGFELRYLDHISGQRRDGSKLYDIHFEISGIVEADSVRIAVLAFSQSGDTLPVNTFVEPSDTGLITTSGARQIIWNIGDDVPDREFYSDSIFVRVIASMRGYSHEDCYARSFCIIYSDGADKIPVAVGELESGGYYFVYSTRESGTIAQVAFTETDSLGAEVESYLIFTRGAVSNPSAFRDENGAYWINGITIEDTAFARNIIFMKIDSLREVVFAYTYRDSLNPASEELAYDLKRANDGGFIISGQYAVSVDSTSRLFVAKVDSTGAVQWARAIGSSGHEEFARCAVSDDAIYISGHSTGYSGGGISLVVLKLDFDGNLIWARNIYDDGIIFSDDIVTSFDDGCVVIAHKPASSEIIAIKLDAEGEVVWSRAFGGDFAIDPFNIIQVEPSFYLISAYSRVAFDRERHSYLCMMDDDGNIVWQRLFNHGSANTTCRAISQNSDGSFVSINTHKETIGTVENILLKRSAEIPRDYFCCMFAPDFPIRDIALSISSISPDVFPKYLLRNTTTVEVSNTSVLSTTICD